MILVIGGMASGKRSFARSMGYEDVQMADAVLDERPVVFNVQDMGPDVCAADFANKDVVICNEVGCGVVPISADERAAREHAGRLCVDLAAQATAVVRMVCGIPVVLEGELPSAQGESCS